jgi:tetratricopeptide (TPR) repeat protein
MFRFYTIQIVSLVPCSASLARRVAVSIPLLLMLAGCHTAGGYIEKGNAMYARGQFAEASLNYRKAIQKDPNMGEAYYKVGLTEQKQHKVAEAFEDMQRAVQLMPNDLAVQTALTNLLLGAYFADPQRPKFLYDLLLKFSHAWLAKNPNSLPGLRIRGYLAMLEQRTDEAVSGFQRAHRLYPRDEKIMDGLMDALFRSNQQVEAERVGLDFLATDPIASDVYDALYRMYVAAHRTKDAENILIRKVNANPKQNSYVLQLAGFYAGQQRKQEMDQAMQKFLSNSGSDSQVPLEAGDFYAAIGDFDNALQQYHNGSNADHLDKVLYQNRIARILLLQKNKQEGLRVLDQTIAQYPGDAEARELRAALLVSDRGVGNPGEGLQEFRSLYERDPDDVLLKFLLARALAENKDYSEARSRLLEIVKLRPQFLEAQILLSDIAFKRHDTVETILRAEAVLQLDPGNLRARMLRGSALLQEGNIDEAGSILGGLLRQVPDSVDVRLQLAYVALDKRRYAEAEAGFSKVLETHPDEWRAAQGLVATDLAQNRRVRAVSRLEEELARSHGSHALRYLLATTALRTGNYNTAIENFRELAVQTPNSIDAEIDLANVFRLKGDIHNAIVTLQKAAMLQPKDPRPASALPFLLEMEDRAQEAKQVIRHTLAQRPDDAEAMNNLAYLLAQTGDSLDEALRLARKAVNKSPDNPAFLDTLGYVYLKRDQNDDALNIFQNLILKYPNDPACAYHTGLAWYQKGDRAKAKTLLSHALELQPPKDIEAEANDLLRRIK